jgi:hypothetical protein
MCRRDSFITHRAFCDALAEESARAVTAAAAQHQHPTGILFSHAGGGAGLQLPSVLNPSSQHGLSLEEMRLKRERQPFASSWLTPQLQQQQVEMLGAGNSSAVFSSARLDQDYVGSSTSDSSTQPAGLTFGFSPSSAAATASAVHMSATALLQKAAQMGATLSRPSNQGQMAASTQSTSLMSTNAATATTASPPAAATSNVTSTGLNFGAPHFGAANERSDREAGNKGGGGNDGLTRDFLGLRAFSHGDILNIAGFDPCLTSASSAAAYGQGHHPSSNKPWHA